MPPPGRIPWPPPSRARVVETGNTQPLTPRGQTERLEPLSGLEAVEMEIAARQAQLERDFQQRLRVILAERAAVFAVAPPRTGPDLDIVKTFDNDPSLLDDIRGAWAWLWARVRHLITGPDFDWTLPATLIEYKGWASSSSAEDEIEHHPWNVPTRE